MTAFWVSASDYLLAIECAFFAALAARRDRFFGGAFAVFFAAVAAAAALGGTVHGFFPEAAAAKRWLWGGILAALGVAGMAAARIGGEIFFSARRGRWAAAAAAAGLAILGTFILDRTHSFFAALLFFLPPILFLLAAFVCLYQKRRAKVLLPGMAGLILISAAALAPLGGHNTLYHLLVGISLLLLFWTACRCTI